MLERWVAWMATGLDPAAASGAGLGELILLPFYLIRAVFGVIELLLAGPIGIGVLLGMVGVFAVIAVVTRRRSDGGGPEGEG